MANLANPVGEILLEPEDSPGCISDARALAVPRLDNDWAAAPGCH